MVAVIKTSYSLHRIFNYNENKVKEGVASCIGAENYPKDLPDLTLTNKLNRLLNQAALNENVKRNAVHISLNFDPSETLTNERLVQIAKSYMKQIGFGNQPYIVYQHFDAGHPHIHIVSLKVRENGQRIDTQNIGRNQSEVARKNIEKIFGLVKAEDSKGNLSYELPPIQAQKVQYGKSTTKRAITNVLDAVLNSYKYASLPELNAVLKRYNVMADRGNENSTVFKNNGLLFRVLDEHGNKTGIPIKASDFYNKPTLKFLQDKFSENESKKLPHKTRIKNILNTALMNRAGFSLSGFIAELEKAGISTTLRQNENGLIYGITYVDHTTKCVFNGSSLGKLYSANSIQQRLIQSSATADQIHTKEINKEFVETQFPPLPKSPDPNRNQVDEHTAINASESSDSLLELLFQPEYTNEYIPGHLKPRRKKKRKKRI